MATGMTLNQCSMCDKGDGMCNCTGCKAFFCVKHFHQHRQELSDKLDQDVGVVLNKLLEQFNEPKQSNNSSADLLHEIDQWEIAIIEKIHMAAQKAREQLNEQLNGKQNKLRDQFDTLRKEFDKRQAEENFVEYDIKRLEEEVNHLQRSFEKLTQPSEIKVIVEETNQIDWDYLIYIEQTVLTSLVHIPPNATWTTKGIIAAAGNRSGQGLNQLNWPHGLYVDNNQILYIADCWNHRIVRWKSGTTSGQVVAGGNGKGNRSDQLNFPTNVIVDKQTDSLIICDSSNRRVVRWSRVDSANRETIISNVKCYGLMMHDDEFLYISDDEKHEVRRWRIGETQGTLVAGGNGKGNRLDQLNTPHFVFIDRDQSVYVSDECNNRVMKWMKGAKEGIVVAGGQGQGHALTQLSSPQGVIVDQLGNIYVADCYNNRIMCWAKGATQGTIIVGGNGKGDLTNKVHRPMGLSFDAQGNLYVVEWDNNRVKRFSVDKQT